MWFFTRRKLKTLNKDFVLTINLLKDILIKEQISEEDLWDIHSLLVKINFFINASGVKNIFIEKTFNELFDVHVEFDKTSCDVFVLKYSFHELVAEGKLDYTYEEIDQAVLNILSTSIEDLLEAQANNNNQNLHDYVNSIIEETVKFMVSSYPEVNPNIYGLIKGSYHNIMNYTDESLDYLINDYFSLDINIEDFSENHFRLMIIAFAFDIINSNAENKLTEEEFDRYLDKVEVMWLLTESLN